MHFLNVQYLYMHTTFYNTGTAKKALRTYKLYIIVLKLCHNITIFFYFKTVQ